MDYREILTRLYQSLYAHYGPQGWWPGETPFEIMVGAILTQNTNWQNVERAIANLKTARMLDPHRLFRISDARLAQLIRPAGYFNVKAKRLKALIRWLVRLHEGKVEKALAGDLNQVRAELLAIPGVGPETADSILLYAGNRPTFVVDAYTRRILARHGLIQQEAAYEAIKALFERSLPAEASLFNEYHALLVRLGKEHCRPQPRCTDCPARTVFAAAGNQAPNRTADEVCHG